MSERSYYYKPVGKKKENIEREELLEKEMEEIAEWYPRYGYRRMTQELKRRMVEVNQKKVLRLMREKGLLWKKRRRFVRTTDSKHGLRVYPNLIKDLGLERLNQVWVADITYIRLERSFVYLAVILDALSRRVIGYALSRRLDTSLTLSALRMAISQRIYTVGTIHHSDQGVQYASEEYVGMLRENGFQISMGRKGNPYDNAKMESFYKTLKSEEVSLNEYETIEDAWAGISNFITEVYNRKRLHSSLGYRPPEEFEELLFAEQLKEAVV